LSIPAHTQLAVIGGGPAGLRAAEVAAIAGLRVVLFDAMPSPGRKFLVAGKGGLNLTNNESAGRMAACYSGPDQPDGIWRDLLADFDPAALRSWAEGLGVETFEASNGRVYPKSLKAAPMLRAWIRRLRALGVRFGMNHRWTSLQPGAPHQLEFSNGARFSADAVVFALGGASWPQTGSDGRWMPRFESLGIGCHPLVPANCGWNHPWSNGFLAIAEGQPIKNIHASAGDIRVAGELLVTRHGLEGGAIYQLGPALRAMSQPAIAIDLKPTFSHEQLVAKMQSVRRGFLAEARVRWRLGTAAHALLARMDWHDTDSLAHEAKHCVIPLDGPRPIAESISSAGGVCWSDLDGTLMLRQCPGVFVAGEMIDWEAPTGGFLMQGCFATGSRAAHAVAAWLA
jgi:uncharacterized flavoprotein (TIGR03862 family)